MGLGVTCTLIAIVLAVGFDYLVLVDIREAPYVRSFSREAWGLICILSTPLGGLLYLMYGRPPGRRA